MQRFFRSAQQAEKDEVTTSSKETCRFPPPPVDAGPLPVNQKVDASASNHGKVLSSLRKQKSGSSVSHGASSTSSIRDTLRSPPPDPKIATAPENRKNVAVLSTTAGNFKSRGSVDEAPLPRATNITAAAEANRLGSSNSVSPIFRESSILSASAKEPGNGNERADVNGSSSLPSSSYLPKISNTTTESESLSIVEIKREKDLFKDVRGHAANRIGRHSLPSTERRVRFSEPPADNGLIFVRPSDVFSDAEEEEEPTTPRKRAIPQSRSFMTPPRTERNRIPRSQSHRVHSDLMGSSSLSERRQERQSSNRFAPSSRKRSENPKSPVRSALGAAVSFPSRLKQMWYPKPEVWGEGIKAALLYLPDSENDGRARSALRSTKLAGMSSIHDQQEVVRPGMPFKILVVGTHLGVSARKTQARAAFSETVVRSRDPNIEPRSLSANHAPREGNGAGYMPVPDHRSLVLDASSIGEGNGNQIQKLSMHVVLGDMKKPSLQDDPVPLLKLALDDGPRYVNKDITWEICSPSDKRVRRGAIPLRYGYYFILGEACSLKLYCQAVTPEHMRLVAMTQVPRGVPKKELPSLVKNLSYLVVRISEA